MSPFSEVLNKIHSELRHHDLRREALIDAAFIIETYKGWKGAEVLKPVSSQVDMLSQSDITAENIQQLQEVLLAFLLDNPTTPCGDVVWALSKLQDRKLIPVFEGLVLRFLDSDPGTRDQALLAIEDLSDNSSRSFSALDEVANRDRAVSYLKKRRLLK